jgi:hypothetical protein
VGVQLPSSTHLSSSVSVLNLLSSHHLIEVLFVSTPARHFLVHFWSIDTRCQAKYEIHVLWAFVSRMPGQLNNIGPISWAGEPTVSMTLRNQFRTGLVSDVVRSAAFLHPLSALPLLSTFSWSSPGSGLLL